MGFELQHVLPWGRSFDEYRRLFALTDADMVRRIVGCADGPASFNAVATRRGTAVRSCDPLYRFSADAIRARIAETYEAIMSHTRKNMGQFTWETIRSLDELGQLRTSAMNEFLNDYEQGKAGGRYIDAELPSLPFVDGAFDLALCSHFLFLYTEQLGRVFHVAAMLEMCRIAAECRIFPLLTLAGTRSPLVQPVSDALRQAGFEITIQRVQYEFQKGGNEMMRVVRAIAKPEPCRR